jgi:hypothetical protein
MGGDAECGLFSGEGSEFTDDDAAVAILTAAGEGDQEGEDRGARKKEASVHGRRLDSKLHADKGEIRQTRGSVQRDGWTSQGGEMIWVP